MTRVAVFGCRRQVPLSCDLPPHSTWAAPWSPECSPRSLFGCALLPRSWVFRDRLCRLKEYWRLDGFSCYNTHVSRTIIPLVRFTGILRTTKHKIFIFNSSTLSGTYLLLLRQNLRDSQSVPKYCD